jgi:hypothetical protein
MHPRIMVLPSPPTPRETPGYTRYVINKQRWYFYLCLFLATCFGAFVLPFLLPPPYLAGISAANVAGFNNKVAALATAALGAFAGITALLSQRTTQPHSPSGDFGKIPFPITVVAAVLCGCMISMLSYVIAISNQPYGDDRYFIHQISMYVDYGRKLYYQIEFTYGPLLFYGTAILYKLLSPLHVTLNAAYYITLVIEQVTGLMLVAYVLNALPILRRWKIVFLLLCLLHTYPFGFGLNYTFFRFGLPIAILILAARQSLPHAAAACFFAGQMVCLAISPELGFAFAASSFGYCVYQLCTSQRAWILAAVAPFAATALFFLIAGNGYLSMLKLFARGIGNFVVEPLPYVLVYLFALVCLVPPMLARFFLNSRPEAPLLAALYVFAVALVPAAFGRSDPGHVFFNGLGIYFLSLVAISEAKPRCQQIWMTCVVLVVVWSAYIDGRVYAAQLRKTIREDITNWRHPTTPGYQPLDISRLQTIVGREPVFLPFTIPYPVEEALKRSGQFIPTFFDREWSILDASAEDRQLAEFNAAHWAILPVGFQPNFTETQQSIAPYLGHRLPYHSPYPEKRTPYVVYNKFNQNLAVRWRLYQNLGEYDLYRRQY